ncbi:hypothetical protein FG379_002282 [Cryptosporidium bovis]|uniref:uncharacterized protein n=1 Tax=Cryptosporidium bovis TaxID=310047 RepID=UPI00351A20B0|nr:hypothetical protein FG379_002282 [Cryptosporidium bovis]
MHNSEEIVTKFGHPILRNRIIQLLGFVPLDQSSVTLLSNLIENGWETIHDFDGFHYKIYFPNNPGSFTTTNLDRLENLFTSHENTDVTNINSNDETIMIIEVYHENINQFWNDGFQLIQYYKNIVNIDINFVESSEVYSDHIKIYVPRKLSLKIYYGYPKVLRTPAFFAFEMLTCAIRNLLYCANILNSIRYISYFWDNRDVNEGCSLGIDSYIFFETSDFSGKKLHTYYPNTSNEDSNILIALELFNQFINEGILTNNFLQELAISINQFDYIGKKNDKIMFFLSKSIPKNVNEIEELIISDKKENNLFLIITVPVSWLHSTNDSKKLFLAAFISTINNLIYQIIPQCKCLLRCGLRKNIMELTSQESKGY